MHGPAMALNTQSGEGSGAATVLAAGGLLGALAASSCCILPVVLFGLGIGGAWIGNFTQLAPYQPYFLGFAVACLGVGYWLMRRSEIAACADGQACARPLPNRVVRILLFTAALVIVAAFSFNFLAPYVLT